MKVLNARFIRKKYTDSSVKTTLKKTKKGYSVVAIKPIKRRETIAYYRFKLYRQPHRGVINGMYTMTVYTKSYNESNTLIGDLYPKSIDYPKNGIPYWGYFCNEPSLNEQPNAALSVNLRFNYKNSKVKREGGTMVYKIYATRNIQPGEEITWCYGDYYHRGYKSSCAK